jgi:UDP-N-acetylmuramoyl-L-alanyl-D-glutamate--2,6-diaminopimelate ligase
MLSDALAVYLCPLIGADAATLIALVVERPLDLGVPEVRVQSVRAALAPAAAAFYGDPTATLQTVGITGTNGKTTTAFLLRSLLEASGHRSGLLGTVKSVIGGTEHQVQRTTPEAIDLQRTFRAMLDAGDRACVMEVSSHALELGRVEAIHFAAAVFTNLTQDHVDFHSTLEDYFGAKRRLFVGAELGSAVLNVDDPTARAGAGAPRSDYVRTQAGGRLPGLDVQSDLSGCRFGLQSPDGAVSCHTPLGESSTSTTCSEHSRPPRALQVPIETALQTIATAGQVPDALRPSTIAPGPVQAIVFTPAQRPP